MTLVVQILKRQSRSFLDLSAIELLLIMKIMPSKRHSISQIIGFVDVQESEIRKVLDPTIGPL